MPSAAGTSANGPSRLVRIAELGQSAVARHLRGEGLDLQCGPVVARIRTPVPRIATAVSRLYAAHEVANDGFADFHVSVSPPRGVRRWWRPQVRFWFDQESPFHPLPANQAFPMLEWGLNWSIVTHLHDWLILHAAVVARDGRALILPAPPGSGKSTLCAGLVQQGWRLLSDELALIHRDDGAVVPLPRPVSLKNAAIQALQAFAPDIVLSEPVHDTVKGTVTHMQPPEPSVAAQHERSWPAWIVQPAFDPDGPDELRPAGRAETFMALAENAFNYNVLGTEGFDLLAATVDRCECFRLAYSSLAGSTGHLERLS